jgi:hypothetical protein
MVWPTLTQTRFPRWLRWPQQLVHHHYPHLCRQRQSPHPCHQCRSPCPYRPCHREMDPQRRRPRPRSLHLCPSRPSLPVLRQRGPSRLVVEVGRLKWLHFWPHPTRFRLVRKILLRMLWARPHRSLRPTSNHQSVVTAAPLRVRLGRAVRSRTPVAAVAKRHCCSRAVPRRPLRRLAVPWRSLPRHLLRRRLSTATVV